MINFTIGPVSMDPEIAMIGSREHHISEEMSFRKL